MATVQFQLYTRPVSVRLCECRQDNGQQVNGDSGSSIRTWARKLDSTRDPLAAVRKAEEEEKQLAQQRAQEEDQARLRAQEEEQARIRAQEAEQARIRAEEEQLARRRAEEQQQARIRAEEEQQAWRRAEEEQQARRRAEEEQQARRRAEEEQQSRRRAEQEQQARRRAEEEQQLVSSLVNMPATPWYTALQLMLTDGLPLEPHNRTSKHQLRSMLQSKACSQSTNESGCSDRPVACGASIFTWSWCSHRAPYLPAVCLFNFLLGHGAGHYLAVTSTT